jgi:signal transduction histidine kinase
MAVEDLKPHREAARYAAARAQQHVQDTLDALEAARADAQIEQLTAERGRRVAEAAQLAAEAARDAAEIAQAVAETASQEAERAHLSLQNFLAMAAHDIRGPLTAIDGNTDVLMAANAGPADRNFAADAIHAAVRQMDRLVGDIVDAGRLGAGAFLLHFQPLDLVSLVQDVARGQQAATDRHRIVIDASERLEGEWDPDRLGQVMTNLISNAIKYSPDGGDIAITVRQEQDAAVVIVADRGSGINSADLPSLFRPFVRLLSPEGRAHVRGTGLGLYISQGIVQAHGGRMSATSLGRGTGSAFTVRLPLNPRSPSVSPGDK